MEPDLEHISLERILTFFHELGHVMHTICEDSQITRFSAIKTEKDFVELPSKLLELWVEDIGVLSNLTENALPLDLAEQKVKSMNFKEKRHILKNLYFSISDFIMETAYD